MEAKNRLVKSGERKTVEMLDGIFRTTMCFNNQSMLCHFSFKKGSSIPLHNHIAVQNGYVIKGKVRFLYKEGSFIVEQGDGYIFDSEEYHGSEVLEDSEVIECFTPMRPEYIDS